MIFGTDARAAGAAALFPLPLRDFLLQKPRSFVRLTQLLRQKKLSNCLYNGLFLIL
jgi:hypothetical protein